MRPFTRMTSIGEPYSCDSTGFVMTSSTVPSAARPLPRYSTRSSEFRSGLSSCAENSTVMFDFPLHAPHEIDDARLMTRIEADQRFVEQQQLRIAEQALREQQALPLAARQLR